MILRNSVKCLICSQEIESKYTHDFKFCKCGNIAVDGGREYLKRGGKGITYNTYEDTSIYTEEEVDE